MSEIIKTFKLQGAQGDVLLVRCPEVPGDAQPVDHLVLAHSETGHHHTVEVVQNKPGAKFYRDARADGAVPLQGFLEVTAEFVRLKHAKKGPDAHQTLRIPTGVYEVRRAREWNPWTESERRVAD